jgi:hypothetical protein
MKKYKRINCPECGRDLPIIKGKICTHGPGKSSLFCSGSGQEAHLTNRQRKADPAYAMREFGDAAKKVADEIIEDRRR